MKILRYAFVLLLQLVVIQTTAQVVNIYTNGGTREKWYMSTIDSMVLVPTVNYGVKAELKQYYQTTVTGTAQTHVLVDVTVEPQVDSAFVAFGEETYGWYDFSAGQVPFAEPLQRGTTQTLDFVIPDTTKTYYVSASTYNIRHEVDYTAHLYVDYASRDWVSLGTGQFKEDFLDGTGEYYDVEIQQNGTDPTMFRVVDPYHKVAMGGGSYSPSDSCSTYFQLQVKKDFFSYDFVYYPDVNTGYYHSSYDADIYAVNPYRFTSLQTESGCQYNKVVEWQDNGLPGEIELAPYYYMFGVGGWNYTQKEGTIDIIFPGYVKLDMSVSLQYDGVYTADDGTTYACGYLALGADAVDARAVVAPQSADVNTVANAIASGELDALSVTSGGIEVPFDYSEMGSSDLQLIVVVLKNGNVVCNFATCNFKYTDGRAWMSLGYGTYTDDAIITLFSQDEEGEVPFAPITYTVEIQESTETSGLYRIMDPYAPGVYPYAEAFKSSGCTMPDQGTNYIEVNATDPEGVYIATQDLGVDLGDGAMGILTNAYRYMANYDVETLKRYGYMGVVRNDSIIFPSFYQSSSDHSKGTYQGFLTEDGDLTYYMGTNQQFTIVLPNGVSGARRKALSQSNAKLKTPLHLRKAERLKKDVLNKRFLPINVLTPKKIEMPDNMEVPNGEKTTIPQMKVVSKPYLKRQLTNTSSKGRAQLKMSTGAQKIVE